MPLPLIAIGVGAVAAGSAAVSLSQNLRIRKFKKTYNAAYEHLQDCEADHQRQIQIFNHQAETYGYAKALAGQDLQKAVDFFKKAKLKHREFQVGSAADPILKNLEYYEVQAQNFQTLLRAASGPAAAAGAASVAPGIYAAVGLFGVASTGTRIITLSGAAAHAAKMAAIGRLIGIGGSGMAAGAASLSAVTMSMNIITLPIALGAGAWSVKKAFDIKKNVEDEIKKMAAVETRLARRCALMKAIIQRMIENKENMAAAQRALLQQLQNSDPDNLEQTHAVYQVADVLAHAIDAEVITPDQAEELGIKISAPSLPPAGGTTL